MVGPSVGAEFPCHSFPQVDHDYSAANSRSNICRVITVSLDDDKLKAATGPRKFFFDSRLYKLNEQGSLGKLPTNFKCLTSSLTCVDEPDGTINNMLDMVQEFAIDNAHAQTNYKLPIVSKTIMPWDNSMLTLDMEDLIAQIYFMGNQCQLVRDGNATLFQILTHDPKQQHIFWSETV